MAEEPFGARSRSDHDDPVRGRDSRRVDLLQRASAAVRRAHAAAEQANGLRSLAREALQTSMENLALADAEREARAELEDAVRRFAELLRADGTPPQVAVRNVKSAVEPEIFSPRDLSSDVEWRRAVASDVVKWFVAAYYAA